MWHENGGVPDPWYHIGWVDLKKKQHFERSYDDEGAALRMAWELHDAGMLVLSFREIRELINEVGLDEEASNA